MMISAEYPDSKVCIVGLGYVGLTLAVAMADVGFRVVGVEKSPAVLEHLRRHRAHFAEVGLDAKLSRQMASGRLTVTDRIGPTDCTTYIVTVGTPVDDSHRTKLDAISQVSTDIARVIRDGDMVILRSTVRIGITRDVVKPLLDASGRSYDLAFCPERTLEGKALEELRTLPQIVGGIDDVATLRASRMFHFMTPTIVHVSSPEAAEMAKLVNNTYRDLMFAYANEVASIADRIGVSAPEVIRAGGLGYPRGQLPLPGPVGGPCLEKDPYILAESVAHAGYRPGLTLGGRALNESLIQKVVYDLQRLRVARGMSGAGRISLLGLAFKGRPETSDLRGTLAIPLIAELRRVFPNASLNGFDPVVPRENIDTLGITPVTTLEDAFEAADLVVVQNNHPLFGSMSIEALSERLAPCGIVYDLWNQHEVGRLALRADTIYVGLGAMLGRDKTAMEAAESGLAAQQYAPLSSWSEARGVTADGGWVHHAHVRTER